MHKFWPTVGGTQKLAHHLALGLINRGHSVTVLTSGSQTDKRIEEIDKIIVKRSRAFYFASSRPWYVTPRLVATALQELGSGYDVVHSFHFVTFQSLVASCLRRLGRIPFVLTPSYHPWQGVYEETFGTFVLRSADALIAQCRMEETLLSNYVKSEKITEIPDGIDSRAFVHLGNGDAFRKKYGFTSSDRLILYVGQMGGRKSVSDLVSLMPAVTKKIPDAKLVLVGGGGAMKDSEVRGEAVRQIGRVTDSQLIDAYSAADVFALPSQFESFGIVLLEAAASGLPIVSRRVGVAPEIIQDGRNGLLQAECDESFAMALCSVLSDSSYRKNAEEKRSEILARYDWEKIVDSMISLYEKIVGI